MLAFEGAMGAFRMHALLATLAFVSLPLALAAQEEWKPAQLDRGQLPATPIMAVAGGEVFLELTVTAAGTVLRADTLRTTPPFTDAVIATVRGWRFRPAERTTMRITATPTASVSALVTEPVESKVLVAAIYRPPSLQAPTLGEPPRTIASAASEVAFPQTTATPGYPPLALSDGTVLIEVAVGTDGRVGEASVIQSAAGFDQAALDAARQWTFQPARIAGRLEETYAYLVMVFRQPVTGAPGPPGPVPPGR
jgi:TonB family protein